MAREIRIRWLKGQAKGSVDVLPVHLFAHLTTRAVREHVVEFSGSGEGFAKFSMRVEPLRATLDYGAHRRFNVASGMQLGTFSLEFTDARRSKLKAVFWEGERLGADDIRFGTVSAGKAAPARLRRTAKEAGGGFGTAEQNALAEKAAIMAVRKHLTSEGWTVRSVEAEKNGFDLECIDGKRCAHVEVKGIRGNRVSFILTSGERARAVKDPHFQLFAVTRVLSAPTVHRYKGQTMEARFAFTPLQWKCELK